MSSDLKKPRRFRRGFFLLAALVCSNAHAAQSPSFLYDIKISDGGYDMDVEMTFPPALGLDRVIAYFKDPGLMHELNPSMDPVTVEASSASRYQMILPFRVLGLRFRFLSDCTESRDASGWTRSCRLDTSRYSAPWLMERKSDETSCAVDKGQVRCRMKIQGKLKRVLFLSEALLSVKAKYQALVNWGLFWSYARTGGTSSGDAHAYFDRAMSVEAERFLKAGMDSLRGNLSTWSFERKSKLGDFGATEPTRNSRLDILDNGASYGALLESVARARKFVFLNFLWVACDASSEGLIRALEKKAADGVDVRVVTNRFFSRIDGGCASRMQKSGIRVLKANTHSSYLVNDQGDLIMGSESIARMYFLSDGHNRYDRDLMLKVQGPAATDAVRDFSELWIQNGGEGLSADLYLGKVEQERTSGVRGADLGDDPRGVCRFASDAGDSERSAVSDLWVAMIRSVSDKVVFTGVYFEDSPAVRALIDRARGGLRVDFLGNGPAGGDGELSMYLDELAYPLATWIRDAESRWKVSRERSKESIAQGVPGFRILAYPSYLHYKAWVFDQTAAWVGSANPDLQDASHFAESGILCEDPAFVRELSARIASDQERSGDFIH